MDKNRDLPKSVFGTLKSELDESPDISPEFLALEAGVQAVRLAYMDGKISAEHAGAILRDLKLIDVNDCTWTIGATSTRWYRKVKGGAWELSVHPENVALGRDIPEWVNTGVYEIISRYTGKGEKKEERKLAPVNLLPKPVIPNSDSDRDWLFEEWETEVKPAMSESALISEYSNDNLSDVPRSWSSDSALDEKIGINNDVMPASREDRIADALDTENPLTASAPTTPENDFTLPEDYFLKDDDNK